VLLYYITDRIQFPGTENERRALLLQRIKENAGMGVDFIQLREKDLCARDLESLARAALENIHGSRTRLLINSRSDVALAVGAHGVHLRSDDISPAEVRNIWRAAGSKANPVIAVSCHSEDDVIAARNSGADFVVFGPVFGKASANDLQASKPMGLEQLRRVCQHGLPVLALGGATAENAQDCLDAGAAGIAGIRFFQPLHDRCGRSGFAGVPGGGEWNQDH
jgi:thiamine-phosphate pyrophosphorylase